MPLNDSRQDLMAARRARVAHHRLRGKTTREIAALLAQEGLVNIDGKSFSHVTVKHDLDALDKVWKERANADTSDLKAQELAKLDEVEREAWLAWEASLQPRITSYNEIVQEREKIGEESDSEGESYESDDGEITALFVTKRKSRTTTEFATGDPRYLDIIKDCGVKRAKLLGLEAPVKVDTTVETTVKVVRGVSFDDL